MSKHIISVLGGNGYIGKRIIDAILKLEPNSKVYAICRTGKLDPGHYKFDDRVQIIKGDCLKPEPLQDIIKESTGIVHSIGALFSFDANIYDKLNRQTCIEVAKIANNNTHKTNFVYISAERGIPFPLSLKFKPYIETKRRCENQLMNEYTNLNTIILRPGFVMDARDRSWSIPLYYGVNLVNFAEKAILNKVSDKIGRCLELPAHGIALDTVAHYAASAAVGKLEGKKIYNNEFMLENKI
jgi:nucleoside-diphosphate-sugar epimerase